MSYLPIPAPEIEEKISRAGIIAVIVIDNSEYAIPLANALLEGGIDAIELTLRTSAALESARIIKEHFPEMTLGFGTMLNLEQVNQVVEAGADFAVSPGCNP